MGIRHIRNTKARRVALLVCWAPMTLWFFVFEALRLLVWHAVSLPYRLLTNWWGLLRIIPAATREAWRGAAPRPPAPPPAGPDGGG